MSRGQPEIVIVGGGIVGMATAMTLATVHRRSVVVLEAELQPAAHQSGHNTGVIHSGIFYRPGTLKARLCVEGRERMHRFCDEQGIRHERCGKVIIARRESDLAGLKTLEDWARANGLTGVGRVDPQGIKEHEPHATGLAGLFVPEAGIVDYAEVTRALAEVAHCAGAEIRTGTRLLHCRREDRGLVLGTSGGEVRCRFAINCAGGQSDRVARICGDDPGMQVVPFQGQFYELVPGRRSLVRNLVYPVPDLSVPFLGIHIVRTIRGEVEAAPNGALAFSRQGYHMGSVTLADTWEMLRYRGFWLMALRYLRTGLVETVRALSKRAFLRTLQQMIPELRPEDARPGRVGIHAQAVEPSGALVDDFRIVSTDRTIHVLNTTSPAATSSLALARHIAETLLRKLDEPPGRGPA